MVGGHSQYEISFCLNSLANKNQSVLGVHAGTRNQLKELVQIFSEGKVLWHLILYSATQS